jgi:serine/threonine-protein kinase
VSVVKALAGRKVPTFIAHAYAPDGAELVVLERYSEASTLDALEKSARASMTLRHPNVATVRDVWREGSELCIAMEFVEGETLEELRRVGAGGKEFTIEVGVRVIVDVLAALSAIHTTGQGGTVHGEVTATNVIVGFDGTTRLVRPFHGAVAGKAAEPDWFSYAAPEVVKGSTADVRADLYAVGVLLWETLSRRKLFPKATREGRAARSMPVGKPTAPPDAGWAAPLGAVAERALANDPSARYTTAAEMAAAVRLAVRSKLAMPPRVSAAVDKLASERILARRNANALPDPSGESNRVSMPGTRPSVPPEAVRALSAMRPSSRPPTPQPGPVAVPVIPKSPPLPKLDAAKPDARPRPIAPPIAIAPPIPKPPSVPPPPSGEFLDIAIDSVREPTPTAPPVPVPVAQAAAIATPSPMPTPMLADSSTPAGVPAATSKRKGLIWIGVAVLFALVALAAVIRTVVGSGNTATPAASTHPSAKVTTTSTATSTATVATATTTATATTSAATTTTTATPESSGSAEPEPSSTGTAAPTDTSHRPHTRPRPTYDPMGI